MTAFLNYAMYANYFGLFFVPSKSCDPQPDVSTGGKEEEDNRK